MGKQYGNAGQCNPASFTIGNFIRLVVRYDPSPQAYRAFFRVACFMIVLWRVVQGLHAPGIHVRLYPCENHILQR
jgi:hypothetical protein